MTRKAVACLLAPLAVCAILQTSRAQSPSGNRVIAGIVVSAASGRPLDGSAVALRDTRGFKLVAQTVTDASGNFSFPNLPDGKFILSASHRGYAQTAYEQHDGPLTAIVTGENLITTGITLSLPPLGAIFGAVAEDSGDPVPRARLMLYRISNSDGTNRVVRAGQIGADEMGNFEFPHLAPGDYFLCASGTPWYRAMPNPGMRTSSDQPRSPLDVAYPLNCYPDTADPNGAEPITVKAGERAEANLPLHPVPAVHIVFQEPRTDPHGGFAMPQLRQEFFGFSEFVQPGAEFPVSVPQEGDQNPVTIEITGVPPGQYNLEFNEFQMTGANGTAQPSAGRFSTLDVSSSDVTLDASSLQLMASVTGKLIAAGGENLPSGAAIELVSDRDEANGFANVAANGEFRFSGMKPGNYEVLVRADNRAWPVTQLKVNGAALKGSTLKIGANPIDLTVTAGANSVASVAGFATRNGKPASGVFVLLVPANPRAGRFGWQPNQSDSDGSFTFDNVPPGQYTVVAIDHGWTLAWRRPEVIAPYLANGAAVTIASGSKQVDVKTPLEAQTIPGPHAQ